MKLVLKVPAVLIALAIWFLSSQSTLPQPKGILGFDKVQHLIAYAAFAGAIGLWFSLDQEKGRVFRTMLVIVVIASVYGISDEIHQYFVPGRNASVWDWVADTLGAILGAAAILAIARRIERKV
ncbi:MAG: VanZ family protein [Treponema sp.]|jgi:VanZ family protein|nr:VanZ family protein [Treponema sp.]